MLVPLASLSSYNRLLRAKMTARSPCSSVTSGLLLSHPILSCLIPFYSVLFHPILYRAVLIPSHLTLSCPIAPPIPFHHLLCCPLQIISYSILSYPILSYDITFAKAFQSCGAGPIGSLYNWLCFTVLPRLLMIIRNIQSLLTAHLCWI